MAIKTYQKRYTSLSPQPVVKKKRLIGFRRSQKHHTPFQRVFPIVLMTIGSILLANAVWPILSYELFTSPQLRAAEGTVLDRRAPQAAVLREYLLPTPKPTPKVVAEELDYTDLSNWFPQNNMPIVGQSQIKRYKLTIPAVDIQEAEVVEGGMNLDRSLIQYPGTSNPGEYGSPVIFGHSVLRQFYNPSINNPRRYVSIFSKIMTLKNDDKIYIELDGVKYTYRVIGKTEVKPEDTFILEQHHDVRELKLVTCVPEGTYLRRGVVTAQLED
jgi:sortase A